MQYIEKTKKNTKRRTQALIFLSIVCCIFLSATAGITYMILKSTNMELELQVERDLLAKVHERASRISTWYGSVTNQFKILSRSDLIRLFTYEATQNFSNYADMIELSKKEDDDSDFKQPTVQDEITVYNEGEFPEILAPKDNKDRDIEKLAQQLVNINNTLFKFIERSDFLSAYIFSPDFALFASHDGNKIELTESQKNIIKKAMEQNSFVISNSYRTSDKKIVIDMVQPILAPAYISEGGEQVVGVLFITLDATFANKKETSNKNSKDNINYWLIQLSDNVLIKYNSKQEKYLPLSDEWKVLNSIQIPFAIRTSENNQKSYSLGVNVSHLPWFVVADIPVTVAKNNLYNPTNLILFISGVSLIIILLLITYAWWWLVGQEERKSKEQIVSLYSTIERQKTLLENVNSNLQDGILMKNKEGKILYANDAFAKMMQDSMENIIGSDFKDIFIGRTNMPVNLYINEVLRTGEPLKYNEMIKIDNEIHHYQVIYAPYKTDEGETDGIVGVYTDISDLILTQNKHQLMSLHLIEVLKRIVEAFDTYLIGHSTNIGRLAVILAYMQGLNEQQVSVIKTAASLSQIGMIQLPYELRSKTSVFTPDERLLMETHVELAKHILNNIDFGLPLQKVIYQMYEKLDGTGYPNHLKGDEICIESRILAVANIFCAIMRPRIHRESLGLEHALKVLSINDKRYDSTAIEHLHIWLKEPEGISFVEKLKNL